MEINLRLADVKEPLPDAILSRLRRESFTDIHLYPRNSEKLAGRIAEKHDLYPHNITLVNGVAEGIDLMTRVFGKDMLIFLPTYYEFYNAPRRNHANLSAINCFNGRAFNFHYNIDDVRDRTLIMLCNPNNPFGILSREQIIKLANETRGIVCVDETYISFGGESVMDHVDKIKNLAVMRSFSKGYSMAGFRIGYIAGSKEVVDKINDRKIFCSMNSVSVNAANIALDEEDYFRAMSLRISKRKERFENFLEDLGYDIMRTHTNGILIKFRTESEASMFNQYLQKHGILVNQGDGVSTYGLDNSFIRIACGTEEQMNILMEVVSGYKK